MHDVMSGNRSDRTLVQCLKLLFYSASTIVHVDRSYCLPTTSWMPLEAQPDVQRNLSYSKCKLLNLIILLKSRSRQALLASLCININYASPTFNVVNAIKPILHLHPKARHPRVHSINWPKEVVYCLLESLILRHNTRIRMSLISLYKIHLS